MAQYWVKSIDGWPHRDWKAVWDDEYKQFALIQDDTVFWATSGLPKRHPEAKDLGRELRFHIPPPPTGWDSTSWVGTGNNKPDLKGVGPDIIDLLLDPNRNSSMPNVEDLGSKAGELQATPGNTDKDDEEPDTDPSVDFSETFRGSLRDLELNRETEQYWVLGRSDEGDILVWIGGNVLCYILIDKESGRCWWFKPGMLGGCPAAPPLQFREKLGSFLFPSPPADGFDGTALQIPDELLVGLQMPDWVFQPYQYWLKGRYEIESLAWDTEQEAYIIARGEMGSEVASAWHYKPGSQPPGFPSTPPDPSSFHQAVHINIPFPPPQLGFDGSPTQITFTNSAASPRIPEWEWVEPEAILDTPAQKAITSSVLPLLPEWKDDPVYRYKTIMTGIRAHSPRAPKNPFKKVFWEYWWTRFVITLFVVFWFCYRKCGDAYYFMYGGLSDIFGNTFTKAAVVVVAIVILLLAVGVTFYATFDRNPKPSKPKKVFSGKPMKVTVPKKTKKRAAPKPAMQRPKPPMEPVMALPPTPPDPPDPPTPMDMASDPDPPAMRKRRQRRRRRRASMRTKRRRKPKPRPMKFRYKDLLK